MTRPACPIVVTAERIPTEAEALDMISAAAPQLAALADLYAHELRGGYTSEQAAASVDSALGVPSSEEEEYAAWQKRQAAKRARAAQR